MLPNTPTGGSLLPWSQKMERPFVAFLALTARFLVENAKTVPGSKQPTPPGCGPVAASPSENLDPTLGKLLPNEPPAWKAVLTSQQNLAAFPRSFSTPVPAVANLEHSPPTPRENVNLAVPAPGEKPNLSYSLPSASDNYA